MTSKNHEINAENTNIQVDENVSEIDNINRDYSNELNDIINAAPDLIKNIVNQFTTVDEKTMVLYSALTLAGALMPNVTVNYAGKISYPALMLMAIFPPASGKGCLKMVQKLGSKINAELMERNRLAVTEYRKAEASFKKSKQPEEANLPERPKQSVFFAPGNITSSKLVEHLSHNGPNQMLTIFETETDALGLSASNSQYGSMLSTILRQAFEFETISQSRKTDSELYSIPIPKLAVILSGTLSQVTNIFKSNEDGLFSRFMLIMGYASAKWVNVKPDETKPALDDYFECLADCYYDIWKFLKGKKIEVKFTNAQWDKLNAFGERYLAITHHFTGEMAGSIAKRHGNMITRMAAILTMVRYYDRKDTADTLICTNTDFDIAMWMIEKSLNWSLELYNKLPQRRSTSVPQNKLLILSSMPETFELKDIQPVLPKIKTSRRTLSRWMAEFVDGRLLERQGHGVYKKTTMAHMALAHLNQNGNEND